MKDYIGCNIPKLGFGLMRLPQKDGVIDIEQVKQMADHFFANGFTYCDTAYVYGGGASGTTVASTDLTLLSGDYKSIFGGSNGGTVSGDTNVVVGGNAFITSSIPEGARVSVKSQELLYNYDESHPAERKEIEQDSSWYYNI